MRPNSTKGGMNVARINRAELTRHEIVRYAANRFLENGYSNTSISSMCKALNMSTGNMTFYFPTKEHLLIELVDMLCAYQSGLLEEEAKEGYSSVMSVCLEIATMAAASEMDEIVKDFFISAYISPMALEIIRRNDTERAKRIFKDYCPDWTDENYIVAQTLVSGIEYATLMTTSDSVSVGERVKGAIRAILSIYNVPKDIIEQKIEKTLKADYSKLGLNVLDSFKTYVNNMTEQALLALVK